LSGNAQIVRCSTTEPMSGYRCSGTKRNGARCNRLLLEIEEGALYPGKFLRIKCGNCNAMNFFTGMDAG
jgi:phage FluMu protein Com